MLAAIGFWLVAHLDWLAAILELIGFWLIGRKKRKGFVFCMFCSVVWVIVAYRIKLYGLLVIAILCAITHARNYRKWGKGNGRKLLWEVWK